MKIAVQLYTLRDLLEKDTWATLRRLSEMGFRTAELAGTYGKPVDEFAKVCKGLGLQIIAPHVGLDALENRPEEVISTCIELETDMAVLPWVDKSFYGDGWAGAAIRLQKIGMRLAEVGIRFLYHNHAFEFETEGGVPGFDLLWSHADPRYLGCEMDAFWVTYGGGDPTSYLRSLGPRVRTIHFKDMDRTPEKGFEDVGYGKLDWPGIISAAQAAKVEYAIIERDSCTGDPLQHVARSRDYLIDQGLSD